MNYLFFLFSYILKHHFISIQYMVLKTSKDYNCINIQKISNYLGNLCNLIVFLLLNYFDYVQKIDNQSYNNAYFFSSVYLCSVTNGQCDKIQCIQGQTDNINIFLCKKHIIIWIEKRTCHRQLPNIFPLKVQCNII